MHDGSFDTLEEVVDYYSDGVIANPFLDVEMVRPARSLTETIDFYGGQSADLRKDSLPVKVLKLTRQEKADLVAFMKSLDGEGWQHVREPTVFPQ